MYIIVEIIRGINSLKDEIATQSWLLWVPFEYTRLWKKANYWPKYHQCWISWETTHIFLFLWPGIHGLFFEFLVVFTKMLAEKIETLMVFMKCKIKKRSHLVPRLARAQPVHQVVSIYFICAFHETTKVSNFLPIFIWNYSNSLNNQWN